MVFFLQCCSSLQGFTAWSLYLPSAASHHESLHPAFFSLVFYSLFSSWTGCPSSLCHFSLFLPLPFLPPDLVQTTDRRFCRCGSSLVFFFPSLSVLNLWCARMHTHTCAYALPVPVPQHRTVLSVCQSLLGTLRRLWGASRDTGQK